MPAIAIAHGTAHGCVTGATNPDRWMWHLHRPWCRVDVLEGHEASLV
jgi:hypothetical protein